MCDCVSGGPRGADSEEDWESEAPAAPATAAEAVTSSPAPGGAWGGAGGAGVGAAMPPAPVLPASGTGRPLPPAAGGFEDEEVWDTSGVKESWEVDSEEERKKAEEAKKAARVRAVSLSSSISLLHCGCLLP